MERDGEGERAGGGERELGLGEKGILVIFNAGPNDLSIYQYKCTDTYELGYKLFLYFHAKVSGWSEMVLCRLCLTQFGT